MKLKKIALLSLATLMIASAFTGCAKKTDVERVSREVLQTPVTTPDNIEKDNIEYKKELYFHDAQNGNEYWIGFTEDEYYLIVNYRYEYKMGLSRSNGHYSVDEDGNYVLDAFLIFTTPFYFLDNEVEAGTYASTSDKPIVISKMGGIYVDNDNKMMFVDTDSAEGKFLWFDSSYGKYDITFAKGEQKPESIKAYLVDGSEGVGETVTLRAENFTEFDTSATGETTVTVTYNDNEYKLSCYVYEDGEYTRPEHPMLKKYKELVITQEAYNALPTHITPDTTAEEYFASYKGEGPMFYTEDGVAVNREQITVEHWVPDKKDGTKSIYYRVKVEKDGIIYNYIYKVFVCREGEEENGSLFGAKHNNDSVTEKNGIWYIPKGTSLDGVTADLFSFKQTITKDLAVQVSDYQAFKLGGQVITLSYGESTMQQMVYVYDDSNVILTEIKLEGLKLDGEGKADLTEGKIIFVNCDGTVREADMTGYMNSITVDGVAVTFKYNSIIDNVKYPFVVTEVARAAQN